MNSLKKKVAVVCRIMPLYRLAVFRFLSSYTGDYEFTFLGDTNKQGGIEPISRGHFGESGKEIRWVKTKNYFFNSERLLWQTGIIKRILFSDFKYYIFEGAIAHLPTWLFSLLCKIKGRKVLFWTHGFKGLDKGLLLIIRTIYYKYFSDGLLLYGHFQRDLMIKHGFDPKKLFVIYNSLDVDRQYDILKKIDRNNVILNKSKIFKTPQAFTVIFIGRLVKTKKVNEILIAISELKNVKNELNCIIIGDGPEKEVLNEFIREKQLDNNVYLAGEVYDEEEIAKYFLMSDLLVSPGNVGLNCMHSLVYGVPVLTHDNFKYQNPEVEAIIPGKTGIFYKYGDLNSMIAKIREWEQKRESKEIVKAKCNSVINSLYNPVNHGNCIIEALDKVL